MATYVLVHGAWGGGSVWDKATTLLRADGHDVYSPTLTGMGERAHLLSPSVGLYTHITDIVDLLVFEDLTDVILVGHSYGGMVVTGVAARAGERLAHLVYLDAFVPADGQCLLDVAPAEQRDRFLSSATKQGDGWRIPPATPERYGVTDEPDRSWFAARLTPQPLLTFLQAVQAVEPACPRTFIHCLGAPIHAETAERLRADQSWQVRELASGHMAMLLVPRETADMLRELLPE